MPVKLRITLLFGLIVFLILMLVCGTVYYYSYTQRIKTIRTRLTNRNITMARLLGQTKYFDQSLIRRIDSSTALSVKQATFQAYDYLNNKIYSYSDAPADTLPIDTSILDDARVKGSVFFYARRQRRRSLPLCRCQFTHRSRKCRLRRGRKNQTPATGPYSLDRLFFRHHHRLCRRLFFLGSAVTPR